MKRMNRKMFMKKAGFLSLTALSGSTLLSACGGSTSETKNNVIPDESAPSTPSPAAEDTATDASNQMQSQADCSEYNQALTEADLEMRKSLEYVAESPKEDQFCNNCRFWQPDDFEGACGGCQLFAKGAVNPQGWCRSWVAKEV